MMIVHISLLQERLICNFLFLVSIQVFTENVKSNRYDIASGEWIKYVDAKVNGKPVTNWKHFNRMAILEGADGIYWEPSANNDYTLEFSPKGTLGDGRPSSVLHFRLQGFVLY